MPHSGGAGERRHRLLKWLTTDVLDIVVGAAMTGFFFAISATMLGEIAGVITALLAAGKYAIRNELKQMRSELHDEMEPLIQLRHAIDIAQSSNIVQIDEIMKEYLRITDHEFRLVKDGILLEAIEELRQLAYKKTSRELATGEYYAWLLPLIPDIRSGQHIYAVSLMRDAEWDDSEPEAKFLEENLAAAARGVLIERIFVMPRAIVESALMVEAVRAHAKEVGNGLMGFLAVREDIESRDPELLKRIGDGFFKMGDVALVDKFSVTGEVRGYVTKNVGELRQLDILFGQLKVHARPLSVAGLAARPKLVAQNTTLAIEAPKKQ